MGAAVSITRLDLTASVQPNPLIFRQDAPIRILAKPRAAAPARAV
jgi:hypothetical protein